MDRASQVCYSWKSKLLLTYGWQKKDGAPSYREECDMFAKFSYANKKEKKKNWEIALSRS